METFTTKIILCLDSTVKMVINWLLWIEQNMSDYSDSLKMFFYWNVINTNQTKSGILNSSFRLMTINSFADKIFRGFCSSSVENFRLIRSIFQSKITKSSRSFKKKKNICRELFRSF